MKLTYDRNNTLDFYDARNNVDGIQVDMSINVEENDIEVAEVEETIFGERVGILSRIFGCRHSRMSRPVTTRKITYRYCPTCGIRRRYNLDTFHTFGDYYYPAKTNNINFI